MRARGGVTVVSGIFVESRSLEGNLDFLHDVEIEGTWDDIICLFNVRFI